MDYRQFFENVRGKRIAVCGIGVSNTPMIYRFLREGAVVYACDRRDRAQLGETADELEKAGAVLRLGEHYLEGLEVDILFRTPGMNYNLPILSDYRRRGVAVTSEMEVFFDLCPATIFAVTGSDGKTTTTTLIAEMLQAAGKKVYLGGNIGAPLLPRIDEMTAADFAVVELSSFQLISMRKSPDVAVVTNVAPNHLDIHKDMDEYVGAKRNILLHQNGFSRSVLNFDNDITRSFSEDVRGQLYFTSMRGPVEDGAYLDGDGMLRFRHNGQDTAVFHRNEIAIVGEHNIANYLSAIAAVWGYVPPEAMAHVARTFPGVEHRIEFVREVDGVRYYNDSMASSPTRTIAGLRSFDQQVILLAGGYDKHIPFDPMAPYVVEKVRLLILAGPTAGAIERVVREDPGYREGHPRILRAPSLEEAARMARREAVSGDVVLLSPACASFDAYPNFAVRGRAFKEIVKGF